MENKQTKTNNPLLRYECDVCKKNKARCVYGSVSYCSECWYKKNYNTDPIKQRQLEEYKKKKQWLLNYKKDKSCKRCGWNECTDMLAAKRNPKLKVVNNVNTSALGHGWSIYRMKIEIRKYIFLCPNCNKLVNKRIIKLGDIK